MISYVRFNNRGRPEISNPDVLLGHRALLAVGKNLREAEDVCPP